MSTVDVRIGPAQSVSMPIDVPTVPLEVVYSREIARSSDPDLSDLPSSVIETKRTSLDSSFRASLRLDDLVENSEVEIRFLSGTGAAKLKKSVQVAAAQPIVDVLLSEDDRNAILKREPRPKPPTATVVREAYFVATGGIPVQFSKSKLQVAPVSMTGGDWKNLNLDKLFHSGSPTTTAVEWTGSGWDEVAAVQWTPTHLGADGRFKASFTENSGDAWMWWLAGPQSAIGIIVDELTRSHARPLSIPLPPFAAASVPSEPVPGLEGDRRVPADVTEAEVADNPQIYSEDPGEFCRPFKNPERVLGERSFYVISRAEQPSISAEASLKTQTIPTVDFDPPRELIEGSLQPITIAGRVARMFRATTRADAPADFRTIANRGTVFVRHTLPTAYLHEGT